VSRFVDVEEPAHVGPFRFCVSTGLFVFIGLIYRSVFVHLSLLCMCLFVDVQESAHVGPFRVCVFMGLFVQVFFDI